MKGTILTCLGELVATKYGKDVWEKSLNDAGFARTTLILPISDIPDAQVIKLIEVVCRNLNISHAQAAEAFGDYWVNVYSQGLYAQYYAKHKTARELLLAMNGIHLIVTQSIKNAKPPKFEYEWKDEKTLLIRYRSHRRMIDFAVGLIKGVGKLYKESLGVTKLNATTIQVTFP